MQKFLSQKMVVNFFMYPFPLMFFMKSISTVPVTFRSIIYLIFHTPPTGRIIHWYDLPKTKDPTHNPSFRMQEANPLKLLSYNPYEPKYFQFTSHQHWITVLQLKRLYELPMGPTVWQSKFCQLSLFQTPKVQTP